MRKSEAKELTLNLVKTFFISGAVALTGILFYEPDPHPFVFGILIAFIILMTLSSLSIYLNLFKTIRESALLSALSFFVFPVLTAVLLAVSFGDIPQTWEIYLIFTLPYLIVQLYYFVKYRGISTLFHISINTKITTKALFIIFIFISLLLTGIYYHSNREWKSPYYQGYVMTETGNPLSGVTVREDLPVYQQTITDSTGYFRLFRSSGNLCDLIFTQKGYKTDTCSTVGHHFEIGITYSFLRTPGRMVLIEDTTKLIGKQNAFNE